MAIEALRVRVASGQEVLTEDMKNRFLQHYYSDHGSPDRYFVMAHGPGVAKMRNHFRGTYWGDETLGIGVAALSEAEVLFNGWMLADKIAAWLFYFNQDGPNPDQIEYLGFGRKANGRSHARRINLLEEVEQFRRIASQKIGGIEYGLERYAGFAVMERDFDVAQLEGIPFLRPSAKQSKEGLFQYSAGVADNPMELRGALSAALVRGVSRFHLFGFKNTM
jgi:hypothetical protein